MARLSSRLHKIKGALRAQPVEGHAYDTDSALDLGETEFVSTWLYMYNLFLHIHYSNILLHKDHIGEMSICQCTCFVSGTTERVLNEFCIRILHENLAVNLIVIWIHPLQT